ncbi:Protein CURVATURE THYLAKOID 1B, chloroplastic, variant 2 [Sarracenia purpurea var. burkii]
MASTTSTPLSLSSSSSTLIDGKVPPPPRQSAPKSSHSLTLPTLPPPPLHSHTRPRKTAAYCRKIGCSVVTMATGEAPAEVVATELPDIVKRVQEAWDKVDDKYAVTSLAVAGGLGLWVSTGMISVRTSRLTLFMSSIYMLDLITL